jgi:hypothetical protein
MRERRGGCRGRWVGGGERWRIRGSRLGLGECLGMAL